MLLVSFFIDVRDTEMRWHFSASQPQSSFLFRMTEGEKSSGERWNKV